MNKKRNLCNRLAKIIKPYQVIRHSYTQSRMDEIGGGKMKIAGDGICPTLDTRCDCFGVAVDG